MLKRLLICGHEDKFASDLIATAVHNGIAVSHCSDMPAAMNKIKVFYRMSSFQILFCPAGTAPELLCACDDIPVVFVTGFINDAAVRLSVAYGAAYLMQDMSGGRNCFAAYLPAVLRQRKKPVAGSNCSSPYSLRSPAAGKIGNTARKAGLSVCAMRHFGNDGAGTAQNPCRMSIQEWRCASEQRPMCGEEHTQCRRGGVDKRRCCTR